MSTRTEVPPARARLAFADFLSLLKRRGFPVGIDHHIRLRLLLARVGSECSPDDLKTVLCPIFATSKDQQHAFYDAFDAYFGEAFALSEQADTAAVAPGDEVGGLPGTRLPLKARRWPYLVGACCALAAALALAVAWPPSPTPPPPVIGEPDGGSFGKPDILRGGRQGPPTAPPQQQPPAQPDFWQRHKALLRVALPLAILVFWLAWELYRASRRRLILERKRGKTPPYSWPIQAPPPGGSLYDAPELRGVARRMNQRETGEVVRVDVEATIQATIDAFGFPQLRYRPDTRVPEYLVLIDRHSVRDHQAQLFDHLAGALRDQGVFLVTYFFDGDPRVCVNDADQTRVYLRDLSGRYAGHRLLLFGEGDRLLDPITGGLAEWTVLFSAWSSRAILTPEPPSAWGVHERALAAEFLVLPATVDSLLALTDHFERVTRPDPRRVRETHPETGPTPDESFTVEQLEDSLGPDAFRWLCACAYYPELHWGLTLRLGSLPSLGEGLITETNLLMLLRLPWFRTGFIPDDLSRSLVRKLTPEQVREIGATIVRLIESNPAPPATHAADAQRMEIHFQRYWPERGDRRQWRKLLAGLRLHPDEDVAESYTRARMLESRRPFPLARVLPRWLHQPAYRQGIPVLGLRTGVRALGAVALMAVAWVGVPVVERWLETPGPPGNGTAGSGLAVKPDMVLIPAGEFQMGSTQEQVNAAIEECNKKYGVDLTTCKQWFERELPPHRVSLDAFHIDRYEVTNAQFEQFVTATQHRTSDERAGSGWVWQQKDGKWQWNQIKGASWRAPSGPGSSAQPNHPVVQVSWEDADAYCRWAGKRLPTEAEWEKAARGTEARTYPWGDTWDPKRANGDGVVGTTTSVGSYPSGASLYGIQDMAGNVWEWVADWFDATYYKQSPNRNPAGPSKGQYRILRGGSWYYSPFFLRSADRSNDAPDSRGDDLGFRCARGS